jgi:hypothetical protein
MCCVAHLQHTSSRQAKNINTGENKLFKNNSYSQRHNNFPEGKLDSPVLVMLLSVTQIA